MKKELESSLSHIFRMLESMVKDLDDKNWEILGHGLTRVNRLSSHIIQSTKYYINSPNEISFPSSNSVPYHGDQLDQNPLPTREEILSALPIIRKESNFWLENLDLESSNYDFPWTGNNQLSVVLFLIRHGQFHLGEISALLNEWKGGLGADHFAMNIGEEDDS